MSPHLEICELSMSYGATLALNNVDLSVAKGEFLTVLGPSGSGKTTLLKIIAGFERPSNGKVRIHGKDVTQVEPHQRNIGMVFQNYALFPHLTVVENVAFPLRMRKMSPASIAEKVKEALGLVELDGLEHRTPAQLSGGQQQRVALARAVVFQPDLLLLDEPFGALDRKLREMLQLEVRRLQRRLGLTTVFITHDQEEALTMSDRIAVMAKGALQQVADPRKIYERPVSKNVADFIGESNLVEGTRADGQSNILHLAGGFTVTVQNTKAMHPRSNGCSLFIRPEHITVEPVGVPGNEAPKSSPNRFAATVTEVTYLGSTTRYLLQLAPGLELVARVLGNRASFNQGAAVEVFLPPEDCHLICD